MQPFYNDTQAVFATADLSGEVNQLFLSVAFSSLTEPAPHTIATWADQGTGTYPLTNNRGATESTNVTIQPNTGEVGGVDKIEFVPNSNPVGLHVDLVSGDLYYGSTDLSGGTGGDVVGPAGATDNALARYDGVTGKLIQDSSVALDDTGVMAFSAGGVQLPNPTPDTTGAVLEHWQAVLHNTTWSGPWTNPQNGPTVVERTGNRVFLRLPFGTALLNGVSAQIVNDVALPVFARPTTGSQSGTVRVLNNGVYALGSYSVSTTGFVTISADLDPATLFTAPSASQGGVPDGPTLVYSLTNQ